MPTARKTTAYRPSMTSAGLSPTHSVDALDQEGGPLHTRIAGEYPLTIYVDGREVVTLMTLGTYPETLALGFLRNQRLIQDIEEIASVDVNWSEESVHIATRHGKGIADWEEKMAHRSVTSGCGQGTVFSCVLDKLYEVRLPRATVDRSTIYGLVKAVAGENEIYKAAGAVHGCALCRGEEILMFVEDVGRHNAADTISGRMWLDRISGHDKIFYTTGRLTSEIVMKIAHMGIPVLLSRSGVTHMGLELARDLGITMIARAKGKQFIVYSGGENIDFGG